MMIRRLRAPDLISAFRKRPWIALVPAAIFHLIFTVSVFSVGRYGVAPKQFNRDGIGEFGRDSRIHKITVDGLVNKLKQGEVRSWLNSPDPLHAKFYSLSVLPMGFLSGSTILAVEPLNLLYYLAILSLTFGLGRLVAGGRAGGLAALIVVFWPSLVLHTTQFLRDPLLLTAFLALMTILVLLLKEKFNWLWATGATLAGAASIYVVVRTRPGISPVITGVVILCAVLLLVRIGFRRKLFALNFLTVAVLILVTLTMPGQPVSEDHLRPGAPPRSGHIWSLVASARYQFIIDSQNVSGSLIDADVFFNSATDVIRYVPRALEIGYLAPFPSMWFQAGQNVGLVGRVLSGVEMMLTYLLEILAGIFVWQNRKHCSSWLLLFTTMIGMLALGLVVVNVGTLYRMRYPFWVLLVIMAAGFLVHLRPAEVPAAHRFNSADEPIKST
jgi:hypothetical protein